MTIGDIFDRRKANLDRMKRKRRKQESEPTVTCPDCGRILDPAVFTKHSGICPDCRRYLSLTPARRLALLADDGKYRELWPNLGSSDPIAFPAYPDKLQKLRNSTGQADALVCAVLKICGSRAAVAVLDSRFLMGSMGCVVGEKICLLAEYAEKHKLPLIIFSVSGGARMQEGLFSLMQMARTSAAIRHFQEKGGFFLSVLCHPTTGGVCASFAFLGDIILAEPKALIGFAGSRVIEQIIGEAVPDEIRQAEAHLKNGMIDGLIERGSMKTKIALLLSMHKRADRKKTEKTLPQADLPVSEVSGSCDRTDYELVQAARDKNRPGITDYVSHLFDSFIELKGDRLGGEDPAVYAGIARFHGLPVTVIGTRKGKTWDESQQYHFGMASPEGYRKALRLARQAERFGRPVITFIDTPGAYPGIEAEIHGQPAAIAENLAAFSELAVPVIAIITGEGGSGGALALAVADEVWMLEHAVYSILSPEGFAAILWKDAKKAAEASQVMRLTSRKILEDGLIDGILAEGSGDGGKEQIYAEIDRMLLARLPKLLQTDPRTLVKNRRDKLRRTAKP